MVGLLRDDGQPVGLHQRVEDAGALVVTGLRSWVHTWEEILYLSVRYCTPGRQQASNTI